MSFEWLNRLVRTFNGRSPRTRAEAFGLLVQMGFLIFGGGLACSLLVLILLRLWFVTLPIAIVVGLVYFLSTKVKLRGDGDGR